MKPILLGSRGSALALAQAELTLQALRAAWPEEDFQVKIIQTIGDQRLDLSLAGAVGTLDKGLFTKELEEALLDGRIDLAVHSLKDLPTRLPEGLRLGVALERADPGDVLISKTPVDFSSLPEGAVIATSSLRRQMQVRWKRADLQVVEVRGNVATRLRRLAEKPEWHATVLAAAGLNRLGMKWQSGRIESEGTTFFTTALTPEITLPAVGQGAIGLELRSGDERTERFLAAINHQPTWEAVTMERDLLRSLGGGCQTPLGVRTSPKAGGLWLEAILARDGRVHHAEGSSVADVLEILNA